MANCINNSVQVKLDGKFIPFKSIECKVTNEVHNYTPQYNLDIRLTLIDGSIIYDNGSRVEIIVNLNN